VTVWVARRLVAMIPTFVGVTFLVFGVTRLVPGGPIDQLTNPLGAHGEGGASMERAGARAEIPPAVLAELERHYHLDEPFPVAYARWLADVARGDLGASYRFNAPVLDLIVARFPVSLYFGLTGFVLSYLVCVPLGIVKAIRHGSTFDLVSSAIVFAGYSIPGWALGAVLLVLLGGGSFLDLVPLGGFRSEGWDQLPWWSKVTDQLHHTILPVLAYTAGSFATLTVLTKNALLENLGQDYVRTAFAKGLDERTVMVRHVLRSSLVPLCTGLGHAVGLVMTGSFLIERVFNIDGIGYLALTSVLARDYAVVMGILVFNTAVVLVGNLVADLLYVAADPRIRFE
jgi:microcin C transport system permease protein